jgi:predicted transcriptional regulator
MRQTGAEQMINLSVRLSDDDLQTLDELVEAVRCYYKRQAEQVPALRQIETTRSSALRDLLSSWRHGMDAPVEFTRITRSDQALKELPHRDLEPCEHK